MQGPYNNLHVYETVLEMQPKQLTSLTRYKLCIVH